MNQLAQINAETLPTVFPPARYTNIGSFTNFIIPLLLTLSGVVLLFILFRGAFMYITAGGNPENLAKAKSSLVFAIVGFVIILLSYFIVRVIGFVLNVDIL